MCANLAHSKATLPLHFHRRQLGLCAAGATFATTISNADTKKLNQKRWSSATAPTVNSVQTTCRPAPRQIVSKHAGNFVSSRNSTRLTLTSCARNARVAVEKVIGCLWFRTVEGPFSLFIFPVPPRPKKEARTFDLT